MTPMLRRYGDELRVIRDSAFGHAGIHCRQIRHAGSSSFHALANAAEGQSPPLPRLSRRPSRDDESVADVENIYGAILHQSLVSARSLLYVTPEVSVNVVLPGRVAADVTRHATSHHYRLFWMPRQSQVKSATLTVMPVCLPLSPLVYQRIRRFRRLVTYVTHRQYGYATRRRLNLCCRSPPRCRYRRARQGEADMFVTDVVEAPRLFSRLTPRFSVAIRLRLSTATRCCYSVLMRTRYACHAVCLFTVRLSYATTPQLSPRHANRFTARVTFY